MLKTFILLFLCCCVHCDLNLPEDSPCAVEGVNGTCVSLYKCYSAALTTILLQSGYSNGPGLSEICSYSEQNAPIVCCTDCKLDANESLSDSVVLPDMFIVKRKKSLSWNKCADYFRSLPYRCRGQERYKATVYEKYYNREGKCYEVNERVKYYAGGGRDAERWEFPHMALLGFGAEQESAQWFCGGSVISERFILTAAHCTSAPSLGPITFAALGILKRSDLKELWKVYKIKNIIVYPEYKSPSKYHDIALLETESEINFGRGLLPACLDTPVSESYYVDGTAPGWGRLGHNQPLADVLQVLELRQFNETDCAAIFKPHRLMVDGYNHSTQMCYGAIQMSAITDTCEGDSGGPLQGAYNCLYKINGITSFGKDCGVIGSAGMYTRVRYYTHWIESVVWPESYKEYYN